MSNTTAKFRAHRAEMRTRKALAKAINNAATVTVRQELIARAQARRITIR